MLQICKEIDSFGNIHLHLDLIAGLPFEDISSFRHSFNQVFQIRPQQLQLGFLKVLKGSSIHRQCSEYGILYTPKAPFEVLQTNWLSFDDILFLKDIEDMVEIYYNSGRFQTILTYMIQEFETPFDFFCSTGFFLHCKQISTIQSFKRTILRNFVLLLAIYQSYFYRNYETIMYLRYLFT